MLIDTNYSGSSEDAETTVSATDESTESANAPTADEDTSENPKVESEKDSANENAEENETDDTDPEKEKSSEEVAEKPADESTEESDQNTAAETIPTPDDFYERNKRSMRKEVMDEVRGYLTLGREAIAEKESLETLVNDFGGEEILNGYRTVHEFIAELPPQSETDDWQGYYSQANNVWESLTAQNEVAAISLAMQGTLALIDNAPNSHETILAAIFSNDLKANTAAKGENSQDDIAAYDISPTRVLELLRLDALGFVPKDLTEYADDFEVKSDKTQKTDTSAQSDKTVKTETKTETQPTPQSEAYAEFEKDFESSLPERIKPALQKVKWDINEDLSFVVANAAENLVRKSENFKLISDHLRAGNAYKTGDKLAVPIKLNKSRVDNAATLQAEQLVKRLLKGLQATAATKTEQPASEVKEEPEIKPAVRRESGKFYSSTEVQSKLQELNGFGA